MMHSKKYAMVKRFYDEKRWTKAMVKNAVTHPAPDRAWITADEYREITGEEYK